MRDERHSAVKYFHTGFQLRRRVIAGLLATACLSGLSVANAQARDPYRIAAIHAGYAAQAKSVPLVHLHMQHVLNCLEGRGGRDYRAGAGDPCGGRGALATLPGHSADRVRANKSIILARVGVTLHHPGPAHYVAAAVHAILTESRR
jgi:hypothetical protein